jgi:hypothetical protein
MFQAACVAVIAWAMLGSRYGFSDTWQLVINTGTTIVTFLMVFMIQSAQNRDARAMQLKLDELIRAVKTGGTARGDDGSGTLCARGRFREAPLSTRRGSAGAEREQHDQAARSECDAGRLREHRSSRAAGAAGLATITESSRKSYSVNLRRRARKRAGRMGPRALGESVAASTGAPPTRARWRCSS